MRLMVEIPVPQLIISSISREGYAQMCSMVSMISMKWPKEGRSIRAKSIVPKSGKIELRFMFGARIWILTGLWTKCSRF
jgi:hypothetical protein